MRSILRVLAVVIVGLASQVAVAAADAPKAVLLLSAQSEQGTIATYGQDAKDAGPLARTLRAPFEKSGIRFVSAANMLPPPGGAPTGLPMADEAATSVARQAGASIAVVVGLVAKDQGTLRATSLLGQAVAVRIRVLDVAAGQAVFDSKGQAASYGREITLARSQASTQAISRASRGLLGKLMRKWPEQQQSQGRLSLIITGAEGWRSVATVIRSLAATRGVSGLHALEIRPDRVLLSMRSQQGIAQVVASLRRAKIHEGSLSVQMSGTQLAVQITTNSPAILPPVPNG